VPRWQSISFQANIVRPSVNKSHLRDTPRDTHGVIADYDDTKFGNILTVHPWRAGPNCGKFIYLSIMLSQYSRGGPGTGRLSPLVHTVAIWTFPFHYYSLKNVMIF
jgi:hypothetical protein